ncbi:RidA family protein [Gordonia sp. CPCC 205515]|uniref:RidA family protein n=1 Tax=Gordonia sp. CPCC 205515 TaxID=3140791 RepID=UPI003AF3720C
MLKERIRSTDVREPADGLWSNCLRIGDLVMVSGMTARADDGETVVGGDYDQAMVVFGKIKNLVEAAGGVMDDVVKMTIYVTEIGNNTEVWKARQEFFTGDFPACTLVEVSSLAKPEIRLEIEATAVVGCSS